MIQKIVLGEKSEKCTTMKHINVLCEAVEADTKNSIGCVAQT